MIRRDRHPSVLADQRAAWLVAQNAANYYRWLQRRQRIPKDVRNEEDLRRYRRIQFLVYRARDHLMCPLRFGAADKKEPHS